MATDRTAERVPGIDRPAPHSACLFLNESASCPLVDGTLPSIWRANRFFFALVWASSLVGIVYLVRELGGFAGLGTSWFPALMILGVAALFTLGSWVPALRVRRVLKTFLEEVPGPTVVGQGAEQVLRWQDKPVEVRGAIGFLFVLWHIRLRLPGEEWTFDTSSAAVVARYVRERFTAPSVAVDRLRPIPWGLMQWLPWGAALMIAALLAGSLHLVGPSGFDVPIFLFGVVVGVGALLHGRARIRGAMGRFIQALQDHGLRVDGPYVVEAAVGLRFVVFTDHGPVAVQGVALGPWGMLHVHLAKTLCQARLDRVDHLAAIVLREVTHATDDGGHAAEGE